MGTTPADSDRQTPYCTQTSRIKRTDRVTAQLGACWETSSLSLLDIFNVVNSLAIVCTDRPLSVAETYLEMATRHYIKDLVSKCSRTHACLSRMKKGIVTP